MRRTVLGTITLMATLLGAAGCATHQEMAIWRARVSQIRSRHLGSGRHEVTRTDLTHARAEAWWGDPVTVSPDQIVAR